MDTPKSKRSFRSGFAAWLREQRGRRALGRISRSLFALERTAQKKRPKTFQKALWRTLMILDEYPDRIFEPRAKISPDSPSLRTVRYGIVAEIPSEDFSLETTFVGELRQYTDRRYVVVAGRCEDADRPRPIRINYVEVISAQSRVLKVACISEKSWFREEKNYRHTRESDLAGDEKLLLLLSCIFFRLAEIKLGEGR